MSNDSNDFNTIAGWALAAGVAALGLTIVTGQYFKPHHVEKGGYEVAGAEGGESGGAADVPIANLLATADAAKGAEVFKKCAACHTITPGGASGTGPNVHGIMGKAIGKQAGFAYSPGVAGKGGNWDWESMNAWLKAPKKFIEGTKMSFAGLSKGEDRANLMAYMNAQGSNLPLPAPVAAAAESPTEGVVANVVAGAENIVAE